MLVLTRKENQEFQIGEATVRILKHRQSGEVRLGIIAPHDVLVVRSEVLSKTKVPYQQAGFDDVVDLGRRPREQQPTGA